MIDFLNQLKFKFSEIITLKQYSKSEESIMITESDRSLLVINESDEAIQERCEMSYIQNYEENHKYFFISHLHDDKNEQTEKITFFF